MNINQMSIHELLIFKYRLLIGKVNYFQFQQSLNMYCKCCLVTIQELLLDDLQDSCLTSLQSFSISR